MEPLPAADTRSIPIPSHHGTRYDDETRATAYQLWSFKHGRNAEAVARELQDECPGLDGRTVRRWAETEGWAARVEGQIIELAPAIHRGIVIDLIAGSAEAASYLRSTTRGDEKAEPARVNAALGLLDRAGFRNRAVPLTPARPVNATAPETSLAEVVARRQLRLARASAASPASS